jgi:hypothetical protein
MVTAGLAGLLIIGTSYGGNSEDANAKDDAADAAAAVTATADAVQVEKDFAAEQAANAPKAAAPSATTATTPTVTCAGTSCTVVFPIAGGTAKVFKQPFVMTKGFASRGGAFTLAGKAVSASKTKPGAAPGYKVTISNADATSITAVVTKA